MTERTPEAAPRTAAGRELLDWNHECILFGEGLEAPDLLPRILAIEAEAAQPATPVGALDVEAHHRFSVPDCDWCRAVRASLDARLAAASEPAGGGEG